MGRRHDGVFHAMDEEDRAGVRGDRPAGRQVAYAMPARADVDPRRERGEGRREGLRDPQIGEPERLAGQASRVGRS